MSPNFILLDASLPDVAKLVTAMVQARDAVERRSWTHPEEPTGEEWWADVLADPRARKESGAPIWQSSERSIGSATNGARPSWSPAASAIGGLRFCGTTSSPLMVRTTRCPTYSTISPHRVAAGPALIGIAAGCTTSRQSRARGSSFVARSSGLTLPPSPPAEKATAPR